MTNLQGNKSSKLLNSGYLRQGNPPGGIPPQKRSYDAIRKDAMTNKRTSNNSGDSKAATVEVQASSQG
jgi:hypothetical protein